RSDERFRRAVEDRQRGEAEHIAGAQQFDDLPPAVGQQLVEHDRAVDDLINAVGAIAFAENMAMLANAMALSDRLFFAMAGLLGDARFAGLRQSAVGGLGVGGLGSRSVCLLHWGSSPGRSS